MHSSCAFSPCARDGRRESPTHALPHGTILETCSSSSFSAAAAAAMLPPLAPPQDAGERQNGMDLDCGRPAADETSSFLVTCHKKEREMPEIGDAVESRASPVIPLQLAPAGNRLKR